MVAELISHATGDTEVPEQDAHEAAQEHRVRYYPHCTLLSVRRAVCLFTTFPGRGITVMVNLWELVRDGRYCPRDKDVFRRVPAGAARVRRHISDLELTCLCICYVSVL
jgi:hypothetical protein